MKREDDKQTDRQFVWTFLAQELEPGLKADESEFIVVSAADVIRRNKKKPPR
jgi:hypothetical protein